MNFKKLSRCLTINTLCDWDCKYCIAETNMFSEKPNKPRPREEEIFIEAIKFLEKVDPDKYGSITLSGGEPGLLPFDKLKQIFQLCYNRGINIDINTNGRIFSKILELKPKDYSLKSCISTIDWHLFPDLEEVVVPSDGDYNKYYQNFASKLNLPKEFKLEQLTTGDPSDQTPQKVYKDPIHIINELIMDFVMIHKIMVRPLIVVTNKDVQYLDGFLSSITRRINPLTVPLEIRLCEKNESGTNKDLVLTGLNQVKATKIINYYKDIGIVSDESIEIINKLFNKEQRNQYK